MAKNLVFLHVGPGPLGVSHADLLPYVDLLKGVGTQLPVVPATEMERAALEILREHKSAGLRRGEVEGAWAGITRDLWRDKQDVVFSQPRFAGVNVEQAALVLDHLAGLEVHVVVTPVEGGSLAFLDAWAAVLRPGTLHIREVADDAAAVDVAETIAGVVLAVRRTVFAKVARKPRLPVVRRRGTRAA